MAVKSQIDINVNAAEFLALKTAFDKYETALKKMPATWQNVGRASTVTKTNFESVAASMAIAGATLATITTSGKEFFQVTTSTARHWHNLSLSTASVAKNIVGATESLLKWTGIISIITGGAGLFGFDRLAQSVSSQRTAALGTGGAYGARAAFVTNFRRFGDPEGLLSRVAEAQSSIKESVSLKLLGLTDQDLKGDPADVAIKALRNAAQIARRDKATGFAVGSDPHLQLFNSAERVRLRDMPQAELEEMIARMRADQKSGRLNLSSADQKGYQDFTTRMEKAGREIETIFVKGLVKLAGPLGELSDATVKLVDKFTEKALPAFIADLAGGIDWLAKEVTKDSFVKQVEGIVAMIGSLAASFGGMLSGLASFARWLGVASPTGGVDFSSGTQPGSGGGGETSLEGRRGGGGTGPGTTGPGGITHGAVSGHTLGTKALPGTPFSVPETPHRRDMAPSFTAPGPKTETQTPPSVPEPPHRPGMVSGGGSLPKVGWWTAGRQAHAYDVLTKAGVSDEGAKGLVSRWMNVEAPRGPGSRNAIGGGHYGIGQWGVHRGGASHLNESFDEQINYAVKELNSNESEAGNLLRSAKTEREGALGASAFERAEHYQTGGHGPHEDDWTNKTQRGMSRVHTAAIGAARDRLFHRGQVSINSVPGGNTSLGSAAAAAGSP